jgi:hypothetical protein
MIEDPVAGRPQGHHFHPRFVSVRSGVGNGSPPTTHQPLQGVARGVHTFEGLKPRRLDQVRQAIRARHLSHNTEQAYIGWIKRFIFFPGKRHPAEMGEAEIGQFQLGV